ncbi:MAG TPA: N-formylglutamate deformylase [Steroidobacteraceae bacterium]
MNTSTAEWLTVERGQAPLVVSIPHAGTQLAHVEPALRSVWLGRMDADWWVDRLYDFARELDATVIKTAISRTVIDVNRDPQSISLYPGMATTELVPTTTFDGVPLYAERTPDEAERDLRRKRYFEPYHAALADELARLQRRHGTVVLYDAHSIRSRVPRLFDGELPMFNIGTYDGRSCAEELTSAVVARCAEYSSSYVVNGRFKGGWITRHYGQPESGVHAIQMELACRAYMDEPEVIDEQTWPPPYSEPRARAVRRVLRNVLERCLAFAKTRGE